MSESASEYACFECEQKCSDLYRDRRDPPLEIEPCLCRDCAISALEERRDELEQQIEGVDEELRQLRGVEHA